MSEEQFTYQPGICNIDNAGVHWRKRLGYICLIAGIVSLAVMYYIHLGIIYRYILCAGFGFTTSLNLFQAKEHFCVMNASKRTFETSMHQTKIVDDLYKDLDMKKRRSMMGKAFLYALAAGCLGLLPL
jgi:hypothetical protein